MTAKIYDFELERITREINTLLEKADIPAEAPGPAVYTIEITEDQAKEILSAAFEDE